MEESLVDTLFSRLDTDNDKRVGVVEILQSLIEFPNIVAAIQVTIGYC